MTNPLLYAGMAAAGYLAGRGRSGRRAVKQGQKFVIVDVSVPGHDRWVDNIIYDSTTEADRVAAQMRSRVSASVRRKRPIDAGIQVIDAVWYGPAEARLQATGMRASRGQRCCGDKREKELLAEIKTLKKGRAAPGGRRAQEGPRPGDFLLLSYREKESPTLYVIVMPRGWGDRPHREEVAMPAPPRRLPPRKRLLLPLWRETVVEGLGGWPPRPESRQPSRELPAPNWTPAKLYGGARTASTGVAQVDAALAAWGIPVPPGTQLWGQRPNEWGDIRAPFLLGTLTPQGSK